MKQRGILATIWLGVWLGAGAAVADRADDLMQEEMSARRIPGAALKVIKGGREIKTAVYGWANLELAALVKPDTVFEIGSVTKQFTAACILLLQQDGRLTVDDHIGKHLPNIPDAWTNATIQHLLTHTSGIKSYTGLDGFELTRQLKQDAFIKMIGAHPLEFQPGESWKYSNTGYNLLGHIVENVSGTNYWQFLRERILQPLGMDRTMDRNPGTIITNRADGYEQRNRQHINRDYDVTDIFAAGAMVSTIDDLAKWAAALDASLLLTTESKAQMWTVQRLNDGQPTQYGFGWYVNVVQGRRTIGHGGSTSGFSASLQRYPDDDLTVILLTNTHEQIATALARKVANFYYADKPGSE